MRPTRRQYLIGTATSVSLLAGCSGDDGGDGGDGGSGSDGSDGGSGGDGGSTGGSGGSLEGTEITFMTDEASPAWRELYRTAGNNFTQETGITVNFEFPGQGVGMLERLTTLVQAGNPPDMFISFPSQEGGQMFSQGQLEPLDDLVGEFESEYGSMSDNWKFNPGGTNYELPTAMQMYHMWYNMDHIESKPASWDEMVTQAEMANSDEVSGIIIPASATGLSASYLTLPAHASGARGVVGQGADAEYVIEDDGNRQTYIETLEWLKTLHQYSGENASLSYRGTSNRFAQGGGASCLYAGSRPGGTAARDNPDIVDSLEDGPLLAQDGSPDMTGQILTGGLFVMTSDMIGEQNVEAAKEFARYMWLEDFDRYLDYLSIDVLHYLPPYPDIQDSDEYVNIEPYQELPGLQRWLEYQRDELLPEAKKGSEIGQAVPFWGPMTGTQAFSQMVNEHLILDKPAADAFDDNIGDVRSTFDDVMEQVS